MILTIFTLSSALVMALYVIYEFNKQIKGQRYTMNSMSETYQAVSKANNRRAAIIVNQWDRIQALKKKALYDAVTELPNRFLFDKQLNRTFIGRNRNEAALFYIDVNGFKAVNDTHGHPVGDAVLKEVANILQSSIRPGDMVARVGGDEFAILIKSKHSKRVKDRIISQFGFSGVTVNYTGKKYTAKIGLSIGAVRINKTLTSVAELLTIADRAMYRAKDICKGTGIIHCTQWGAAIKSKVN